MKIILASGSPRRKKLLQQLNLDFEVQVSNASEEFESSWSPSKIVQELALRKARQVAEKHHPDEDVLFIGADTIVVHEGRILEKPCSAENATQMLKTLSNSEHCVLTGMAIVKKHAGGNKAEETTLVEVTKVIFGVLDEDEIHQYVESGSPMDKAGAYGIQDDWGAVFVKRIEGDFYNVVGLPLHAFYKQLKNFAPEITALSETT